ncbi:MAG: hypothetical protein WB661_01725 [Candidatus Bathyarchaeia archaeon]
MPSLILNVAGLYAYLCGTQQQLNINLSYGCTAISTGDIGIHPEWACMADFSQVPEMMQNQANFATILLIIWRNALKAIKYRKQALNAVDTLESG